MNAEPGQFVDTNIIIYAYDIHAGVKHSAARVLMNDLWHSQTGCLSIQILQEVYVNITQKIATPVDIATVTQIIRDLSDWAVHTPIPQDVINAIRIQQRYQLSFWDAMIVWSAVRLGCAVLWSEDLNHGQTYEGVRVQNPFVDDSAQRSD